MTYHEVMTSISKGEIASAYLFSGEEDFLKEEALRKIISSQVKSSFRSFDLDILYGDDTDFRTFKNRAETPPLGSSRRVLVLRSLPGLGQGDKRKLLDYLESVSPKTCLVLVAPKVDLRKGFYRDVARKTESVVFWKLSDREVPRWVKGRLQEKGLSMEEEALYLLQNSVGNDLFSLANELEKVSLYVGQGGRIRAENIKSVVGRARVDSVFDLNLALGLGELKVALRVLGNLVDWGETANHIVYMVSRHLFILKTLHRLNSRKVARKQMAETIRVPQRYLKDYLRQLERLSEEEIDQGLGTVYRTEVALKSGQKKERLLLELMAASICRPELCRHMPIFGFVQQ